MSPTPEISAAAASDSYTDRPGSIVDNTPVFFNRQRFEVLDYKADSQNGFHATAYLNKSSGEIIIAYRGTDPDYKHHFSTTVQDALVDATMVKDKINPQKGAADAFTQEVLNKAQALGIPKDQITVAGHSLGGTLAEIEAAKYGLQGTTFNAYGAADLSYGISPGGHQVTNYVMAGDVVSAASRHFGEVKVLASQADIDGLHAGGYLGAAQGTPSPNPLLTMSLGDHSVMHFTGEGGMENVLAPANIGQYEARYAQHKAAFDHFRGDVQQDRAELATAMNRADSRNIETTLSNLPPRLQQQLAEYHALHVDVPIQQAVEHNAAVRGVESSLGYMASETRVVGQTVQGMDERLATGARQAGHDLRYVAPGAALTAEVFAEGAHLHGQATHAASEFAAEQWQSAKHAVEQGTHLAGQVDTKLVHAAEALVVRDTDAISDTYQSTLADAQTLSHAAIEGAQRVEKGVSQTYTDAKHAVSQGIHAAEHAASQTYDTLAHPGQWFDHTATPQPSATSDPARHQQRALHGESSQLDRAQEARRQQEIHGHAAAHEAPLPSSAAAVVPPGMHVPSREASAPRHDPSPAARHTEAQAPAPTRHEPTAPGAEPNHAAQQAHQQAMRQAQHERQLHEERSASPARNAPSVAPGRAAALAAASTLGAAATTQVPAVAAPLRDDRARVQASSHAERQTSAPVQPDAPRPEPAHAAASSLPTAGIASAAHRAVADPASTSRQAAEPLAATPKLSPPLDPPAMRDFRHAEHPLNARYQMFRDALGEQGFYEHRPTVNTVPEVRGYSAEQKDRLAAGFTAQLGADARFNTEIRHFGKDGGALLAVERPRHLDDKPLALAIDKTQALARTPQEHAAAWRARELPAPQAVNTARPDPKSLSPDHPGHPDHPRHAMFEHARHALGTEYARWGIQKGADPMDRETLQVMIAAREQRMQHVGAIRLQKDSPDGRIGEYPKLAVYETAQGPQPRSGALPGFVESQALQQAPPVQQAAQHFQHVDQQATQQVQQMQQLQAQINAQAQQGPVLGGPGMGR